MKLITFHKDGEVRLGLVAGDRVVDLHRASRDAPGAPGEKLPADMVSFLKLGPEGMERARQLGKLAGSDKEAPCVLPLDSVRIGPPVPVPPKIICIGLNYEEHITEGGAERPKNPIVFAKYRNAVIGPDDPVLLPADSKQVDYEAELAFVIGRPGRYIPAEKAFDHIAGYTIVNDISARDAQFSDGQWVRGKTYDTFAPMGPHLVTTDEVPDPHNLGIKLRLNGQTMQSSNTSQLIFKIPELVAFLSRGISLEPGDVVATGTPMGVGVFRDPPVLLKSGDLMEVEIDRVGLLANPVLDEPETLRTGN
ncbi:fumarylacetoacetate hydrolase family protein [candidate division KSB1 bacterium]